MAFHKNGTDSDRRVPTERAAPKVAAPEDLEAYSFGIGSDSYVVLTFPASEGRPGPTGDGLTSSECAVLVLVLGGHSNAEIARARGTSIRTIANQVAAVYQKLGVGSRRELGARQRSRTGGVK